MLKKTPNFAAVATFSCRNVKEQWVSGQGRKSWDLGRLLRRRRKAMRIAGQIKSAK